MVSYLVGAGLSFRIVRSRAHQHADAPHPIRLLRSRRKRPRRRPEVVMREIGQAPGIANFMGEMSFRTATLGSCAPFACLTTEEFLKLL